VRGVVVTLLATEFGFFIWGVFLVLVSVWVMVSESVNER
jgi:hypothetical protein